MGSTGKYEDGSVALTDGGRIAYQIHGGQNRGTPVLLVRPLGGSMALWGAFRDALSQAYRVVSFDPRGAGDSSAEPTWVSTQSLARECVQVLDHLDVTQAHVFGISLGGMTATWLAILVPARVAKLCIASTPARGLELSRAGLRRELALAACFARKHGEVEAALVNRILSRAFREGSPDQVLWIEATVRSRPASRTALLKHALAGILHDASRDLHRIEAPTLVLAGQNDALLGVNPSRSLSESITNATFEVIAEAGHDVTLERPLVAAARVSRFFLPPT